MLTIKYHLLKYLNKELIIIYQIRLLVANDIKIKWTIFVDIYKRLIIKWNLFKITSKKLSIIYNVTNQVIKDGLDLLWKIYNVIRSIRTIKWNLFGAGKWDIKPAMVNVERFIPKINNIKDIKIAINNIKNGKPLIK